MPLMTKAVEAVGNRLPKIISPRTHAIIDYGVAGAFVLMGALFWKRNKRAAVAALGVAATEVTLSLLTDYPGGVARVISFETHGRIDAGMAGAIASLPNVLRFGGDPEAKHFRIQGAAIGGVTSITRFRREEQYESEYEAA